MAPRREWTAIGRPNSWSHILNSKDSAGISPACCEFHRCIVRRVRFGLLECHSRALVAEHDYIPLADSFWRVVQAEQRPVRTTSIKDASDLTLPYSPVPSNLALPDTVFQSAEGLLTRESPSVPRRLEASSNRSDEVLSSLCSNIAGAANIEQPSVTPMFLDALVFQVVKTIYVFPPGMSILRAVACR